MRISDWSSDVCSSDLPGEPLHYFARNGKVLDPRTFGDFDYDVGWIGADLRQLFLDQIGNAVIDELDCRHVDRDAREQTFPLHRTRCLQAEPARQSAG